MSVPFSLRVLKAAEVQKRPYACSIRHLQGLVSASVLLVKGV